MILLLLLGGVLTPCFLMWIVRVDFNVHFLQLTFKCLLPLCSYNYVFALVVTPYQVKPFGLQLLVVSFG